MRPNIYRGALFKTEILVKKITKNELKRVDLVEYFHQKIIFAKIYFPNLNFATF